MSRPDRLPCNGYCAYCIGNAPIAEAPRCGCACLVHSEHPVAQLLKTRCPVHGESCGTIPDITAAFLNGHPMRHIEVVCAYRLTETFGNPSPEGETTIEVGTFTKPRKRKG